MESPWQQLWAHAEVWTDLPTWAQYFVECGELLARHDVSTGRIRIAVVGPTRAYAAAFAAAGIVVYRAIRANRPSAEEHFISLCTAAAGTNVKFRRGSRGFGGVLVGCRDFPGGPRIGVQVENSDSGGLTHWIGADKAWSVELCAPCSTDVLPSRQRGRVIPGENSFYTALFGPTAASDFVSRSALDVMIVGSKAQLAFELSDRFLGTVVNGSVAMESSLGDLLRCRRLQNPGAPYRSEIAPGSSTSRPPVGNEKLQHVVIDGAALYLKHRAIYIDAHLLTVFDRTDPRCSDAAIAFRRRFVTDRDEFQTIALPEPPPGIEALAYVETL